MPPRISFLSRLRKVANKDPRYDLHAYAFLYESLRFTQKMLGRDDESKDPARRHVTGRELLEGIRRCALLQFGFMARVVLEGWGVKATDDWGEIVFNLVEAKLLGRSDTDSKEDFHAVYDFKEAFDRAFRIGDEARLTRRRP